MSPTPPVTKCVTLAIQRGAVDVLRTLRSDNHPGLFKLAPSNPYVRMVGQRSVQRPRLNSECNNGNGERRQCDSSKGRKGERSEDVEFGAEDEAC